MLPLAQGWRGSFVGAPPAGPWERFDPLATDRTTPLKQDAASTVLAREFAGLSLIVKRPTVRRAIDIVRRSRAARAFGKTVRLRRIGLPTEVPVLLARRGREGVGIYLRVPGETLADVDLERLADRERTLREVGRVLRETASLGWTHLDAKSTNWMITPAGDPVIIDCDGLRRAVLRRQPRRGLERLLRALREHPQYREHDEIAVLAGFDQQESDRVM